MKQKWMTFAALEGVARAFNRMLHKLLGGAAGGAVGVLPIVFIQSLVQLLGGFLLAIIRRESLFPGWKVLALLILFGANAALMTFLAYLVFTYDDADVSVATFFVAASIVIDVLAGMLFFKEKLTFQQVIGIVIFIGAGYAILNFPSLSVIKEVSPWVLLSLAIAFLLTLNEIIMSVSSKVDDGVEGFKSTSPFVKNGWIGLTTCVLTVLAIFFVHSGPIHISLLIPERLWPIAIIVGFSTLALISFKSLAYDTGAPLALKKLVMMTTVLILVMFGGALFYGEPLPLGKFIGALGFVVSFLLIHEGSITKLKQLIRARI